MSEPATNPLLQGIARALMNPVARDQAQSAVTMGQRMGDMLMAPAQAWKRMVDSGYQPTGQPNDPARDQMAADSMDVSGAVTVGGMPFARPGTLGSAGGKMPPPDDFIARLKSFGDFIESQGAPIKKIDAATAQAELDAKMADLAKKFEADRLDPKRIALEEALRRAEEQAALKGNK